jgi:hypothetical protein
MSVHRLMSATARTRNRFSKKLPDVVDRRLNYGGLDRLLSQYAFRDVNVSLSRNLRTE